MPSSSSQRSSRLEVAVEIQRNAICSVAARSSPGAAESSKVVALVRSAGWLRSARCFANRRAQNMSLRAASSLRSAAALLFNLFDPGCIEGLSIQ
jgi:hypothetical protein